MGERAAVFEREGAHHLERRLLPAGGEHGSACGMVELEVEIERSLDPAGRVGSRPNLGLLCTRHSLN